MQVLTLNDLLGAGGEAEPTIGLPAAQAMEFAKILAETRTPKGRFAKGDLVQYIHRVGRLRTEYREKLLMMFWGWLDPGNPLTQQRIAQVDSTDLLLYPELDCLVMILVEDQVQFRLSYTGFLTHRRMP